jgi:hypothetical protein
VSDLVIRVAPRVFARQFERINEAMAERLRGEPSTFNFASPAAPPDTASDLAEVARYVGECVISRPDVDDATRRWWLDRITNAYRVLLGYDSRDQESYVGVSRLLSDALDVSVAHDWNDTTFIRYWFASFFPDLAGALDEGALCIALQRWAAPAGRPRRGQRGGKWEAVGSLVDSLGLGQHDAKTIRRCAERRTAPGR